MSDVTWLPGSVFDNVDKFVNSLGYQNAGIAIHLAIQPWESPSDRDAFIRALTGEDVQGGTEKMYPIRNLRR
jgi:hypothetical protein